MEESGTEHEFRKLITRNSSFFSHRGLFHIPLNTRESTDNKIYLLFTIVVALRLYHRSLPFKY